MATKNDENDMGNEEEMIEYQVIEIFTRALRNNNHSLSMRSFCGHMGELNYEQRSHVKVR